MINNDDCDDVPGIHLCSLFCKATLLEVHQYQLNPAAFHSSMWSQRLGLPFASICFLVEAHSVPLAPGTNLMQKGRTCTVYCLYTNTSMILLHYEADLECLSLMPCIEIQSGYNSIVLPTPCIRICCVS